MLQRVRKMKTHQKTEQEEEDSSPLCVVNRRVQTKGLETVVVFNCAVTLLKPTFRK